MPSPISEMLRPVQSSAKSRSRSGLSSAVRLIAAPLPAHDPSAPHIYSPATCAGRPLSGRPRRRRSPPASPRRSLRRRLRLPPPVVTATAATRAVRAVRARPAHARARRRRVRPADVGLRGHVRDAQRRPGGARAARARRLPRARRPRARPRHHADAAPAARARHARRASAPGRRCWSGRTGSGSCSPTAPRSTCCCAIATASRAAAALIYATFDLGVIGYWAVPTAPPWYAAARGPHGRRPDAGAAAHDGRVRRAVLEVRLEASVRCPGGQPPGRHALAALRHLGDRRAPARRDRPRRGRLRLGVRAARSASRSSISASTTWSTWPPASRSRRAIRRAAPHAAPGARDDCRARCARWRPWRGHEGARGGGAPVEEERAAAPVERRSAPPRLTTSRGRRARDHAAQPARCSAASCSPRSRRSTSCCRSSPGSTTRGTGSRRATRCGSPPACVFTVGMFGGYVAMFRGIFARAGTHRLDWRESYQITMAALAATRLFAAGGAGGLVLTAWALRRAGMRARARSPTRRSRSSS